MVSILSESSFWYPPLILSSTNLRTFCAEASSAWNIARPTSLWVKYIIAAAVIAIMRAMKKMILILSDENMGKLPLILDSRLS